MNTDRFRGIILGRAQECGIRTQNELADKIHVSHSGLSMNMRKPETMSLDTFSRLTSYLSMPAEDIARAIR